MTSGKKHLSLKTLIGRGKLPGPSTNGPLFGKESPKSFLRRLVDPPSVNLLLSNPFMDLAQCFVHLRAIKNFATYRYIVDSAKYADL